MRISDWSSDVCSSDLYVQLVLDKYPLSDRMLPDNIRESSNRECSQSIRLVQFLPQRLNSCMEQARAMLDPLQPLDCARILTNVQLGAVHSSEDRRVGNECVSKCRYRGSPYHSKKKKR